MHIISDALVIPGAIHTLGELVELRGFPLDVGVNEQASCCMRCSMLWEGGTSKADLTETNTLGSYMTTSEVVSSYNS